LGLKNLGSIIKGLLQYSAHKLYCTFLLDRSA